MYISILSDYPCLEVALACVRETTSSTTCVVCVRIRCVRAGAFVDESRLARCRLVCSGTRARARALGSARRLVVPSRVVCGSSYIERRAGVCGCGVVGRGMRETSRPVRRGLVSFFYKSKLRLNLGNRVEARTQCCPSDKESQVVQVARTVELLSNHQKFIQSPKH